MTIIISLLLLASLLPHLTFTARVNVGIVNGKKSQTSLQTLHGFSSEGNEILTAVVGAHNLENENEGSVRIGVKSYFRHPDFSSRSKMNDIMLLKLEEKVKSSKHVNWISLPKKQSINKKDPDCSVAGWGLLSMKGPENDCLVETNVKIMDNATCKKKWRKKRRYSVSQMMCSYSHGGSCKGDSGGPLVCGNTAVGVTSFGDSKQCNSPDFPNVYTKILPYIEWIHKNIKKG